MKYNNYVRLNLYYILKNKMRQKPTFKSENPKKTTKVFQLSVEKTTNVKQQNVRRW